MYIGMVAIILPGVSVADGVMIGAGSVVTKSFGYTRGICRKSCTFHMHQRTIKRTKNMHLMSGMLQIRRHICS